MALRALRKFLCRHRIKLAVAGAVGGGLAARLVYRRVMAEAERFADDLQRQLTDEYQQQLANDRRYVPAAAAGAWRPSLTAFVAQERDALPIAAAAALQAAPRRAGEPVAENQHLDTGRQGPGPGEGGQRGQSPSQGRVAAGSGQRAAARRGRDRSGFIPGAISARGLPGCAPRPPLAPATLHAAAGTSPVPRAAVAKVVALCLTTAAADVIVRVAVGAAMRSASVSGEEGRSAGTGGLSAAEREALISQVLDQWLEDGAERLCSHVVRVVQRDGIRCAEGPQVRLACAVRHTTAPPPVSPSLRAGTASTPR